MSTDKLASTPEKKPFDPLRASGEVTLVYQPTDMKEDTTKKEKLQVETNKEPSSANDNPPTSEETIITISKEKKKIKRLGSKITRNFIPADDQENDKDFEQKKKLLKTMGDSAFSSDSVVNNKPTKKKSFWKKISSCCGYGDDALERDIEYLEDNKEMLLNTMQQWKNRISYFDNPDNQDGTPKTQEQLKSNKEIVEDAKVKLRELSSELTEVSEEINSTETALRQKIQGKITSKLSMGLGIPGAVITAGAAIIAPMSMVPEIVKNVANPISGLLGTIGNIITVSFGQQARSEGAKKSIKEKTRFLESKKQKEQDRYIMENATSPEEAWLLYTARQNNITPTSTLRRSTLGGSSTFRWQEDRARDVAQNMANNYKRINNNEIKKILTEHFNNITCSFCSDKKGLSDAIGQINKNYDNNGRYLFIIKNDCNKNYNSAEFYTALVIFNKKAYYINPLALDVPDYIKTIVNPMFEDTKIIVTKNQGYDINHRYFNYVLTEDIIKFFTALDNSTLSRFKITESPDVDKIQKEFLDIIGDKNLRSI
ncbi:MAG: hypothetical protein J0G32_02735 [Alphaproteobacteria bacterium]|nr:hypothetical protein [Alphaproteobacteria bacterium]OJV13919.1 MAG: hypothetical protein BGO27_08500 [Alphaproteobacteria bacterium 33-17]